jgi:hypothetical protein
MKKIELSEKATTKELVKDLSSVQIRKIYYNDIDLKKKGGYALGSTFLDTASYQIFSDSKCAYVGYFLVITGRKGNEMVNRLYVVNNPNTIMQIMAEDRKEKHYNRLYEFALYIKNDDNKYRTE